MDGCGESDHDHRYLPQVCDRDGEARKSTVTNNGMAKGAGMIAPDMATMLVPSSSPTRRSEPARCQALLTDGVTDTFNAVTIDGDTSTSDTLMAFATGAALDAPRITKANESALEEIPRGVQRRAGQPCRTVARDGEGARKLVEIKVEGRRRRPRRARLPCRSRTLRW